MKNILKIIAPLALVMNFSSFAAVSVIVNDANTDNLDATTIKRIYLGKIKSFPSGGKVTVLTLNDDAKGTEEFRKTALKKSNSQYKSYWSKLAFTGKGTPPKEFANANDVIMAVKADVNAIGFVDSSEVTGDVKVVATFE
ncbi:phosphate ABC transporter substrate-binding protein [Thalassotalea atypica]|uniref:phosphate ABC transporter substrate-binding protein n=1 Tax=Thalassotalea atypica TaxID=2054316 RepID=UPI00257332D2|nr:phosphate ABC transporter substrate-binding protein [Thalassotalea atypica]